VSRPQRVVVVVRARASTPSPPSGEDGRRGRHARNPGIARTSGTVHRVLCSDAPPQEIPADLYVIGPEDPLVDGLADRLRADGRLVFGPGADGARLEGSKVFMKDLAARADVRRPLGGVLRARAGARVPRQLAGSVRGEDRRARRGQGVLVTASRDEAARTSRRSSPAGPSARPVGGSSSRRRSSGRAVAARAVRRDACLALPPAQDAKRLLDGDGGPNTGGMGPTRRPAAPPDVVASVMDRIVAPTLDELVRRGIDYRGVLYAGVMLTTQGRSSSSTTSASATPKPRSS